MVIKLKKGDRVQVLIGKDKGRDGKIEKIFPQKRMALVKGINIVKKHVKPRGEGNPGGIVEKPKPLSICKIALLCSKCETITRVGFKVGADGEKTRVCRKCKQVI